MGFDFEVGSEFYFHEPMWRFGLVAAWRVGWLN